jgi:hypothetical protein
MVDYWTQMVLRPVHSMLFKILKAIPNDATFDQTGVLRKWVSGRETFFCYDLTSATDLMPRFSFELLVESTSCQQRLPRTSS